MSGGHVDARYMPVSLPDGVDELGTVLFTGIPAAMADKMAGRYVLAWTGDATARVLGAVSNVTVVNPTRIEFDYPGTGMVEIRMTPGETPPNSIMCYNSADFPLIQAGETFDPDWLDLISPAIQLRFMDWMMTNNSQQSVWNDRPRSEDCFYTVKGVPVDIMVLLANTIGKVPWFCMPHLASSDYVLNFGNYVRDNLDPDVPYAVFEYSNETWNWQFAQAQYCHEQGQALWPGVGDAYMQFSGAQFAQMAKVLRAVFQDGPDRCKLVLAPQTGWHGLEYGMYHAPNWIADNPGEAAPHTYADAVALTCYWDGGFSSVDNADRIVELAEDSMSMADKIEIMTQRAVHGNNDVWPMPSDGGNQVSNVADLVYHRSVAQPLGLHLTLYEGGQHLVVPATIWDNAAVQELYATALYGENGPWRLSEDLRQALHSNEVARFNWFNECADYGPHGYWGASRYTGDDGPRAQFVRGWTPAAG